MHVDAISKFIFSDLKESTNAVQAVKSKEAFEELDRNNDVSINHYCCDNGVYISKLFTTHVSIKGQSQSFSGIGAHWQNALAERYIGVTTLKARIMLLHAMSRWPDVVTAEFWSFAYQFAVLLHNSLPRSRSTANSAEECPYETFTMSDSPIRPENFHVFGSPCFVLEPALADGSPHPKWQERCYHGVYVGHSSKHASNVAIVFNPKTGLVSPAFHVVFDDEFTSVSNADPAGKLQEKTLELIKTLVQANIWQHTDAFSDTEQLGPDMVDAVGRIYHGHNDSFLIKEFLAKRKISCAAKLHRLQARTAALKRKLPPSSSPEGAISTATDAPPLNKKLRSYAATPDAVSKKIKSKNGDSYLVSKWQLQLITNAPDPLKATGFNQEMPLDAMTANAVPTCLDNQPPPVVAMLTSLGFSLPKGAILSQPAPRVSINAPSSVKYRRFFRNLLLRPKQNSSRQTKAFFPPFSVIRKL
jgi:hypothetical protein